MIFETARDFVQKEIHPNMDRLEEKDHELVLGLLAKAGELGLLGTDIPEEYGGLGLDKVSTTVVGRSHGRQRVVLRGLRRPHRHRDPAHRLFRQRAAEAEIPAQTGIRGVVRRLLPDGSRRRLGRPECRDQGGALGGRQVLPAQRREDVHHQRRLGQQLSSSMPRWTAKTSPASSLEKGFRGPVHRGRGKEDGRPRLLHPPGHPGRRPGTGGKSSFSKSARATRSPSTSSTSAAGSWAPCRWAAARAPSTRRCKYANGRIQFKVPISSFGMIKTKLADMAVRTYMSESMMYRLAGMFDDKLGTLDEEAKKSGAENCQGHRGVRAGVLDRQGVRLGGARFLRGRVRADPRRLRLLRRIPGRALLPGHPDQPDLGRHQRDQPPAGAGNPDAAGARRAA